VIARRDRRFAIPPTQREIDPDHPGAVVDAPTDTDYSALLALTLRWVAIGAAAAVAIIVALSLIGWR
jgi:hypothetical protein